jgi:hypothetical protein
MAGADRVVDRMLRKSTSGISGPRGLYCRVQGEPVGLSYD